MKIQQQLQQQKWTKWKFKGPEGHRKTEISPCLSEGRENGDLNGAEHRRFFWRFKAAERPDDGRENGDSRARSAEEICWRFQTAERPGDGRENGDLMARSAEVKKNRSAEHVFEVSGC